MMPRRSVEQIHGLKVSARAVSLKLEGDMLTTVQNAYRNGWDDATVAGLLGVTRTSWLRVLRRNPALREVVDDARSFTNGVAQQKLFEQVQSGNVTAIIWWQKNKDSQQWRDRHEHAITPSDEKREFVAVLDNGAPALAAVVPISGSPRPAS